MRVFVLYLLPLVIYGCCAQSDSNSLSPLFQDHMVLQQAPALANVFGTCCNGCLVNVTLTNVHLNTAAAFQSSCRPDVPFTRFVWLVSMDPVQGNDPYEIRVEFTYNSQLVRQQTIQDVHFGEVWVCSGQSNMQFTAVMAMNESAILEEASNYPEIRLFTVFQTESSTPVSDVKAYQNWSISSKESVGYAPWKYFSAVCWLFAKELADQHLGSRYFGMVASDWGGTPVEAWSSPTALSKCSRTESQTSNAPVDEALKDGAGGPNQPSVLWNGMIHPLLNMTIKGAIWYQGEANAAAPNNYNCTFPAMIADWRHQFYEGAEGQNDPNFPFGFVQLAPNRDQNVVVGFPDIRWHQTADVGTVPNFQMRNVFMAVAMDLPDFKSPYGSIHPRYKTEVARRLAYAGRRIAYGELELNIQGPAVSSYSSNINATATSSTLRIEFDQSKTTIEVRGKDGFEVCCTPDNTSFCGLSTDPRWQSFPVMDSDDHSVTLEISGACKDQWWIGIRYAWRESPCPLLGCPVYNKDTGLPTPPFISIGLINENV